MKLSCFETVELSDVGRKRKNNEDACLRIPEKGVYCVADGMGGVVGGHLASAAIIKSVRHLFIDTPAAEPETYAGHVALFRKAANAANKWIRDFAEEKGVGQMGSTLVAIVFDPNNPRRAVGLHAGDSRLYRFRNGQLQLLTADHTAAAALAAKLGRDSASIPEKFHNELVRAVGLSDRVELEKTPVEVSSGDVFLLCSDGLTRMLPEEVISQALSQQNAALDKAAQTLINAANEAGGKDNVTVVLIKMGDLSGFPETFEAVDLDEPKTATEGFALKSEPVTSTRSGGATAESSDYVGGDTPETDNSGPIRGHTPKTENTGPPTPPTAEPLPAPAVATPAPAQERNSSSPSLVLVVAAVIFAAVIILGLYFRHRLQSAPPVVVNETPVRQPAPVMAPPAPKPPPPATGGILVQSDPAGADIWIGSQTLGKTPLPLALPPGPTTVTLRIMGLADQAATVTVEAGKANAVNIIFPTGSVAIRSEPPGAAVERDGMVAGYTPCTIDKLAPGKYNWRLTADGWKPKSISVEVADHQTNQASFTMVREQAFLELTGNLPGIMAKLDGAGVGMLPTTLIVDPAVAHTITAEYEGVEQTTNGVRVSGGRTNAIAFAFDVAPAAPSRWTNHFLGLVLVQLSGQKEWAAASRITQDQFSKVMGAAGGVPRENEENGQRYVVNLTAAAVKNFAAKLTDMTQGGDGLPPGAKNFHFAPPTTQQWMKIFDSADQLSIPMKDLHRDKEWCLDGDSWFMAGYVLQGTNFNPAPGCNPITPPPGDDPRQFAIRLVLEP